MSSEILYEVRLESPPGSWCLSGPVGANGGLLFQSAQDAASHARWAARAKGGTINVYDQDGKLFKSIDIDTDLESDDGFILPSV